MDNVKRVQNLSRVLNSKVLIYPDPVLEQFTEKDAIKYYKSDYLTLNGKNLNRASQDSDMRVRIGSKFCNITSLSLNQLTCKPPEEQPPGKNIYICLHIYESAVCLLIFLKIFSALINGVESYDEYPDVVVMIGNNLEYKIGKLSYTGPGEGQLPKPVMIGVAVGAGVLLFIVIGILILYRRKSTESSRVLKNMQEVC